MRNLSLACTNCNSKVMIQEQFCNKCSEHLIHKKITEDISNTKFRTSFAKELNGGNVLQATLHNSVLGEQQFLVPGHDQLGMRIKYYLTNGIQGFLEDNLLPGTILVDLDDYVCQVVDIDGGQPFVAIVHNQFK